MTLIEELVNNMNLKELTQKLNLAEDRSVHYEKRFYFLENRVKMAS
jgi:hypothetical protein